MRLDYIDPFIESAKLILSEISHLKVKCGELSLKSSPIPTKDVVTIISLAGDVAGRVIFEMDDKTALTIAGIMNNTNFEQFTPLVIDSLSEFTNMMIGNAVSKLNDMGFKFITLPPNFFKGKQPPGSAQQLETVVIPLIIRYGEIIMNIAIKCYPQFHKEIN